MKFVYLFLSLLKCVKSEDNAIYDDRIMDMQKSRIQLSFQINYY